MEAGAGRAFGHGWPRFRRPWRWRSAATVRQMPEGPAKTADSEKVPFKMVIVVFERKLCSGASRLVGKGLNQLSWMEPKPLGPGLPVGKVWPVLPWTRGDETILRSGKRIGPGHRQKRGIGWARWLARAAGFIPAALGGTGQGRCPFVSAGSSFGPAPGSVWPRFRRSHVVLRPARYNSPAVRRIRTGFLPLSLPSSRRAFAGFGALWLCCVPAALRHGLARFQPLATAGWGGGCCLRRQPVCSRACIACWRWGASCAAWPRRRRAARPWAS